MIKILVAFIVGGFTLLGCVAILVGFPCAVYSLTLARFGEDVAILATMGAIVFEVGGVFGLMSLAGK